MQLNWVRYAVSESALFIDIKGATITHILKLSIILLFLTFMCAKI